MQEEVKKNEETEVDKGGKIASCFTDLLSHGNEVGMATKNKSKKKEKVGNTNPKMKKLPKPIKQRLEHGT